MSEGEINSYFYEAFQGLPRLSPGGIGSRRKMMSSIPKEEEISILEIGCGMGESTLALAERFPKARIIAIDLHQDYIRQLNQVMAHKNLAQRVQGLVMSVHEMQFPLGQFDVIWAEGSVYLTGFETALRDWAKYLRPNGLLICNDLCWKAATIPLESKGPIQGVLGEFSSIEEHLTLGETLGYDCLLQWIQPNSDWVDGYYDPLEQNLRGLELKYPDQAEVAEVIANLRHEMELFYRHFNLYGYVCFVFQRKDLE